jgi:hypothetical protein
VEAKGFSSTEINRKMNKTHKTKQHMYKPNINLAFNLFDNTHYWGKKKPPFYNLFQKNDSVVCVNVTSKIIIPKQKQQQQQHF